MFIFTEFSRNWINVWRFIAEVVVLAERRQNDFIDQSDEEKLVVFVVFSPSWKLKNSTLLKVCQIYIFILKMRKSDFIIQKIWVKLQFLIFWPSHRFIFLIIFKKNT